MRCPKRQLHELFGRQLPEQQSAPELHTEFDVRQHRDSPPSSGAMQLAIASQHAVSAHGAFIPAHRHTPPSQFPPQQSPFTPHGWLMRPQHAPAWHVNPQQSLLCVHAL